MPATLACARPWKWACSAIAKTVLQALLPLIEAKENRDFLTQAQANMKAWREVLHERGTQDASPMKPQVIPYALSPLLHDDAIVTSDCGNNTTWTARYIQMRENMLFSTSGLLATMGAGPTLRHRGRGGLPRPAGGGAGGRRRLHDADGRAGHRRAL